MKLLWIVLLAACADHGSVGGNPHDRVACEDDAPFMQSTCELACSTAVDMSQGGCDAGFTDDAGTQGMFFCSTTFTVGKLRGCCFVQAPGNDETVHFAVCQ
jgi:hypothetical protein